MIFLVGCASKETSSNSNEEGLTKSESEIEIKLKEIDNVDLMGRTGVTVGFAEAIGEENDHYTIMTRKKEDIQIWLYALKNDVSQIEYLSEIQFDLANGDDGFNSSIGRSKDYVAGELKDIVFDSITKKEKAVEKAIDFLDSAKEFTESLPFKAEYESLNYELSEETMSVLVNLIYYNYYPDVEFTYPKLYDKDGNLLMIHDETGDHHKWLISYNAKFRKFDDMEFVLEKDALKRQEQIKLLTFDIYQLLKGKETQTLYGDYAKKAVGWYSKLEKAQHITPDEVLELYYDSIENPESEHVTNKYREKIKPLLKMAQETLGEQGPPNQLLPEVRLKAVEKNMLWTKVEILEFANESYKTGSSLRVTAIYDHSAAAWYLDDIEIVKAEDKPFLLTWEEVENYASLKKLDIKKSDEQIDPHFFEFSILNENQMFVKGSVVKIDRRNGLISYVSIPEEKVDNNEEDKVVEDVEKPEATDSSVDSSESTSKPTAKSNYSTLNDYEGRWADPNGVHFLTVENVTETSADVWFDICSNNCAQIASVGPIIITPENTTFSHHYDDNGWGRSGDLTLTFQPDGIIVTHEGEEITLSKVTTLD